MLQMPHVKKSSAADRSCKAGIGLPKDFDIDQPRASLGFKVIKSLLGQLDGRITVSSNEPKGAAIQLDLPLDHLPS
jgi:two-component sensor histidine kinase